MIGYVVSFLAGGFCGILGMAAMAYGAKVGLMREIKVLRNRLTLFEQEEPLKKYKPVKDPRVKVDALIN
ncbi:MAG TPA: hypothetical protein ENN17_00065 [bacterium]|nr:hypothetical protein [bacterium]